MLFWVSIIYNLIHCKIKESKIIDIISTVVYIVLGFIALQLCMKDYAKINMWWQFGLKITFYIQFFHLGTIFKKYIEKNLLKLNKLVICGICVAINVVLICIYGENINFYSTANMNSFKTWYLPLITSITGILFYYEIFEFLARKIKFNKIIDFISRNTFVIMQIHLLFVNIPNFYVYLQILNGNMGYKGFSMNSFIDNAWLRYSPNTRLIGFFLGVIGSLLVAYIIERVKGGINNKKMQKELNP